MNAHWIINSACPDVKNDLQYLRDHQPEAYHKLRELLQKLATMPDPTGHCRVSPLCGQYNGWYRVALYEFNIRIVIRFLQERRGILIEVCGLEIDPQRQGVLDVVRIASRHHVYNSQLADRKEKIER